MLYLKPPFEVVEGVSVFGDHENPRQHYVLPLEPRFATRPDSSGREVPRLQVIRYAGEKGTGGFLNLDCDLRIDPERLEAISDHIRQSRGLNEPPLLAPPPMVDGSVRLMLFGHESPSAPKKPGQVVAPGPTPEATRFIRKINSVAKPSLIADEQAAFSVELDEEGVTILDAALRGEMSPIGIVYSLTYAALRPAFTVSVHADWSRVQEHIAEQVAVNSLVATAQIDKVVDKLVEDRVIDIQVDSFVAPGDGEEALLGKEEAVNELKDMVLNTFFEPSLQPVEDKGSFVDTGKRVTQLLATGGIGSLFSYRKTDITRIDQKALNATFSERSAVLRTIYPQGHLAGLVQALEQGLDPSRFTISVNTESDFFKRRTVRVISRADFAGDGIASINVALRYGGETKNVVLDSATPEGMVSWSSFVNRGGRVVRDVQVSYSVAFNAPAGSGRPASLATTAPLTTDGDVFEVAPRDLYEIMSVPVSVVSFPWDRYPSVEVDARYRDPATKGEQALHRVLRQEQEGQDLWQVFVADRAHRDIAYSLLFHGADDRDVTSPEVTTAAGLIRVADPFPKRLALTMVAPAAMFGTVERAFVDVEYDDGATVQKTASYEFSSVLPSTQTFSVELVDPTRRDIAFRAMLVFADGHVVEVPRSVTTDTRLMLRADMKGRRGIVLRPEPVDFGKRGIREVVVETEFEDAVAQPALRFAERFTFQAPGDVARFEFDYVDSGRSAYRYRVTHKYANGLSKPSAWRDSQAAELVIPVR